MRSIIAAVAMLAMSTTAYADGSLGGDTVDFADAFNAQAKRMNLDSRIALSKCLPGEVKVCTFSGGEDLAIMASSVKGEETLEGLFIMFGSKTPNAVHLIDALGATMAMYAPTAKPDERGVIFRSLMEKLKSEDKSGDVNLHNVKFSISAPEGMGIWITVTRDD